MTSDSPRPPTVVIVGGGFAGFQAARSLAKRMGDDVDIVLVSPTNYFLYLPLLPEVAAGILEPRRISVALAAALPRCVRHAPGEVDELDLDGHTIGWLDPEGVHHEATWDRLVIAAGSVHKVLPVPGVTEYAQGFRGVPEALYLRDHLIRQIELAAMCEDPEERAARLTTVVVGGGYTGTEVTAQGYLFTKELAASRGLAEVPRWVLVSRGEILAGLSEHLSRNADRVLRDRGVDVRTHEEVEEATGDGVRLSSSGEHIPTRTLLWCVGVRPDPLIDELGVEVDQGRLVADEYLQVPGHPHVLACGDAAAVPDRARPGEYTAMTAQHAERQGRLAGRNIAASLGHGRPKKYRHRDLGFVVDLGGFDAAANPLGVRLTGKPAHVVARGYHLFSMPGNRVRTAVDWLLDVLLPRQTAQLGLVRSPSVPLDSSSPEVPQHGLGFPHGPASTRESAPEAGELQSSETFPGRSGGSAEAASPEASVESSVESSSPASGAR